jgi:hypothetical protein
MRERPWVVSVIGWLFVVSGSAGTMITLVGLLSSRTGGGMLSAGDDLMVLAVRAAAIVGGAFLLAGRNWARWFVVGWMAFHVVAGATNGLVPFVVHAALCGGLYFALFRPAVSAWFHLPFDLLW